MRQNAGVQGCDALCLLSRGMGSGLAALFPAPQADEFLWEICQRNPLNSSLLQVARPA